MIENILAEDVELSKENIIFYTLADIMLEYDIIKVLETYGRFENATIEGKEDSLLTGLLIAYDCQNIYGGRFFRPRSDYGNLIGEFFVPNLRERLVEISDRGVDGAITIKNDKIIGAGILSGLATRAAHELGKNGVPMDQNELLRFYYGSDCIGNRRTVSVCAPLVRGPHEHIKDQLKDYIGKGKSFTMSQTVYDGTGTGLVCQFGRNGLERRFNLKRKPGEGEINGVIGEYHMTSQGVKLLSEKIIVPNQLKLLYERINAHLKAQYGPESEAKAGILHSPAYA